MTHENLRTGLAAAAAMYPEGYKFFRNLGAITSTQEMQMIFDRAEDIAAWLDAKERGEHVTAAQVVRARTEKESTIEPGQSERIFGDKDMMLKYSQWLDERRLRDNTKSRRAFLSELG
ncbi:hypothetical protein [Microbacterium thalassium]|uniref:Antibiotic biosynthesis monooxygenase (ABM) superfamily enzyme n=1 Tax=Microbacterium thalassium TaxID=362649 RepID=A0A7X0FMH2_9MICO|nr:hypothetical protein [Microbacterium thalassium]MBB6390203.1 antibiotic biosynthesis monooxygenase (ABM) superfamily enzyme [Microbacterium thalassium]GLK25311.1 hypothetical protein GCM10017607_26300 [Microbacterium thalassium]